MRALLLLATLSCESHPAAVEYEPGHEFSAEERRTIQTITDSTVLEVRKLLPSAPETVVLRVQAGSDVIEETGETATSSRPNRVYWTVDPKRGVAAIATAELRRTLFHELHHIVRRGSVVSQSILDEAITEGLATVFERDFAGAKSPWGAYPEDVEVWFEELTALPESADRSMWLFHHPDGRRWIAFKVGTYLVDRAVRASGKSSVELASMRTEEVVALARVR